MPPTICILALSAIADDPRVRRQGEAFHRAGWRVVGVGLPGARSTPPDWPILHRDMSAEARPSREQAACDVEPCRPGLRLLDGADKPQKSDSLRGRLRVAIDSLPAWMAAVVLPPLLGARWSWHLAIRSWYLMLALPGIRRLRYAAKLLAVRIRPALAAKLFWSSSENVRGIHACARSLSADVWLANDWTALPIAARLAAEDGGVYGYDTHEFAAEEYAQQWKWRFWQRPLVCAVERRYIRDAAMVSAVSCGIAERLDEMSLLPRPSLVIRNTPPYEEAPFHPTGERIRVLYHGIVAPGRGLEAAVDSVASWRPEFELVIRGPENPAFSDALRARIAKRAVSHRVTLLPPVPMPELVREAMPFDIGFFALPGHSHHNNFALPNKFFEYVMAGLALCVSDLPEMAGLVRRHDLGVLIASIEPAAIAVAVNGLDRDRIDAFKRNSLRAARELCWEKEAERMIEAYRGILHRPAAASFVRG